MNKVFILVVMGFLVLNESYCQNDKVKELYLLVSHPFYDAEPFPSFLFRMNKTTNVLDTVQKLSDGRESIREVKYYRDKKKIFLVKEQWFTTEVNHKELQIIDMEIPNLAIKITLDSIKNQYLNSGLFCFNNGRDHFFIKILNPKRNENDFLWGFNLKDLEVKRMSVSDFSNVEITGNAGSCLLTFDMLSVYTNSENGELSIPENVDTSKRPTFAIVLPDEFQIKRKELKSILINTDSAFVLSINHSNISKENIGYSDLVIFSKSSNSWFKQRIKGNYSGALRSFGEWIVGTVYSNLNIFNEKGQQIETLRRESPGKSQRRKKMFKTGMPADYRFDYFGVYSPGILYILNVKTRDYIEWNTKQGDSEILMIENNEVYYRVNNEIYKAPILNGKKLGKAKLLIKNEVVPDIHWAFLSK